MNTPQLACVRRITRTSRVPPQLYSGLKTLLSLRNLIEILLRPAASNKASTLSFTTPTTSPFPNCSCINHPAAQFDRAFGMEFVVDPATQLSQLPHSSGNVSPK